MAKRRVSTTTSVATEKVTPVNVRDLKKIERTENGARGHRATGRTKPSGSSVGGHSLKKMLKRGWTEDVVRATRNHQKRVLTKRDRRVAAARARDADPGRS